MFFALFSFMTWHPQWLLIAVPFWVLGTCLNKRYVIMLWLDVLFFIVFIVFVSNAFELGVDNSLLKDGILAPALQYSVNIENTLADLYVFKDKDMLFSIIVVLFLVFYIFNHPRFQQHNLSEPMKNVSWLVRLRFISLLMFIVPVLFLLPEMLHAPEQLWSQYEYTNAQEVPVNKQGNVVQYAVVPGDSITEVLVNTRVADSTILTKQELILEIYDIETNELIAESRIKGKNINKQGISYFKVENCPIEPGRQYQFVFKSKLGYLSPTYLYYGQGNSQTDSVLYNTVQKKHDNDYIEINGKKYMTDQYHVIYQIRGHFRG